MRVVIVGAGVAGLTLGYLLEKKGIHVTILEKQSEVGGLARSYHYDTWSIDIGPHRFHTDDSVVQSFLEEIMKGHLMEISRNSKVFFLNKHFQWPLSFKSLFNLPISLMAKSFRDLIFRPKNLGNSFESYVMGRYGRALTELFFREYTEKFLKIDLSKCHRDWAETGINRATIDKDVRTSSIVDLLIGVLFPKNADTKFLYPKNGPIDIFPRLLADKITKKGGQIETNVNIKNLILENNQIKAVETIDGKTFDADFIFWSGSPIDLEKMLGCRNSNLAYCSTVLCNLLVEGPPPIPSQWEYYGSREIIFCRTSTNTSFNPKLAPEGYYGICAEIVCYEGDYAWNNAQNLLNIIVQNLIHSRIIRNFNSIVDIQFEKVSQTYPIYSIDYKEKLKNYTDQMKAYKNLLAFGRTGGFWYNNMDHSIRSSIDIAGLINVNELETKGMPLNGVFRGDF